MELQGLINCQPAKILIGYGLHGVAIGTTEKHNQGMAYLSVAHVLQIKSCSIHCGVLFIFV